MLNSEASQELHRLRAALEDCLIADMNGLRAIGLRLGRLADDMEPKVMPKEPMYGGNWRLYLDVEGTDEVR